MAEISWALREDPATICLLEDAGVKIHDCCQITTFGRNLIMPEHMGDYLFFYPYTGTTGKYYGESTPTRDKIEKSGLTPDYSYLVSIEDQVEFSVDKSALRLLARKYMPAWHSSSCARYLSDKTSAVLLFLRVYRTNGPAPNDSYFDKGRMSSFQVFKLYDQGDEVSISVNGIKPLISDNRFNYLKDEIIHDLRINGCFIAEYENTSEGKEILRQRISVEQTLTGKYDGLQQALHQVWVDKREQWNEGNFDEFPEDFDMAQLDYEAIYDEVIRVCPSMKSMIEYVRNIKAARKGEYDYLLKDVHENNEKAQESAERIFDMSLRNAVKAALQAYKQDGLDLEDAFQEACFGIWKAVWKHHDDVQVLFPTYCSRWIMQTMTRYLPYYQENCRIPAHYETYVQGIMNELEAAEGPVDFNSLDRTELYDLLVDKTSCDEKNAGILSYLLLPARSVEEMIAQDEDDEFSDHGEEAEGVLRDLYAEDVNELLNVLTPREKQVIEQRYGLDGGGERTLEEVGQQLGVTRERIRQIEKKALGKIVKYLYSRHYISEEIYHRFFKDEVSRKKGRR